MTLVTARHDDSGTLVSIYVNNTRTERYHVHPSANWRIGLPPRARIIQRNR